MMRDLVTEAGRRAVRYLDGVNGRPVVPSSQAVAGLKAWCSSGSPRTCAPR